MFELLTHAEPQPGDPDYAAYLAYEDQQIAFWNAYSASPAAPEEVLPNLNGARTDAGLLGEIARQQERVNAAEGAKLRAVADYAQRRMAEPLVGYDEEYMKRSAEAEVALALKLPPSTASEVIGLALTLDRRLPRTFEALQRGEITRTAAEIVADESANLEPGQCTQLEEKVLPDAGQRSHRSLRNRVRREVEKLDADAVRKRAERAREERTLYVREGHDGMATLCLHAPAEVAHALYAAVNDYVLAAQVALRAEHAEAPLILTNRDERRIGAQRHDAIVDLLATALNIDPWAAVTPAESSFLSPEQIAHLDRHAGTYRPSEAMKRAVRNRDKHCRFPGCRRAARYCDIDHSIAFVKVGGKLIGPGTVYWNLGCVCRFHHQIKQMPGWHLEQDRGRFIWTTPAGLRFITYPPPDDHPEAPAELPDFGRVEEPIPF